MKQALLWICSVLLIFFLAAYSVNNKKSTVEAPSITLSSSIAQYIEKSTEEVSSLPEENIVKNIQVTIGDKVFSATLEENDAAKDFVEIIRDEQLVLPMSDYSRFEKVGSIKNNIPTSDRQITAQSGDIVLYNGNQIVVFYGSNTWSYTKLGSIDDLSGWVEALGTGDVSLTFSIK